ncbi:MAG: ABC-2 family transporter protein [Chloroflexota bacterium]
MGELGLARYWHIYAACVRNCLAREFEFRGAFVLKAVSGMLWAGITILLTVFIFGNVREMRGWTLDRMMVLTGTFLLVQYTSSALFRQNMIRLSELVNKGELDFVLIRPISSQFLVSTRYVDFTDVPGILVGVVYLAEGLRRAEAQVSLVQVAQYAALFICALVSGYSVWFAMVTASLWTGRLNNVSHGMTPISNLARIPVEAYRGLVYVLLAFVLPVGVAATFPAQALLGTLAPGMLPYQVLASLAMLAAAHWFWRVSLRRYSSASS